MPPWAHTGVNWKGISPKGFSGQRKALRTSPGPKQAPRATPALEPLCRWSLCELFGELTSEHSFKSQRLVHGHVPFHKYFLWCLMVQALVNSSDVGPLKYRAESGALGFREAGLLGGLVLQLISCMTVSKAPSPSFCFLVWKMALIRLYS